MRQRIYPLAGLLLGLLLLGGAFRPAARSLPRTARPAPGYLAPDLVGQSVDGRTVRLSDLRGQAVFLNFWASWCGPCRLEMPDIQRLARNAPAGATVLTVNATDTEASPVDPLMYMQQAGLDFLFVYDLSGEIQREYQVAAFPTSLFVDPQGVIRRRVAGPMTFSAMAAELTAALAPGSFPPPDIAGVSRLPEVLALGRLRLETGMVLLLLGVVTAGLLARVTFRRRGLPPGAAGDLLAGMATGALLGSKLAIFLTDPPAYARQPLLLLLAQGSRPVTVAGAALGALAWAAWDLRFLPVRRTLDGLAAPLLMGAAVATAGLSGWATAAGWAAAGAYTAWAGGRGGQAGHTALIGVAAGATVLVGLDFARPAVSMLAGLTLSQWLSGSLGLGILGWLGYRTKPEADP